MTPTLLVVVCVGAEAPVCRLFLPYWERSGCDILFSSPLDDPLELPPYPHFHAGVSYHRHLSSTWWHYQARFLDTMRYCLTLPYQAYVFTQYDSICLGPLPPIAPTDSIHLVAGYTAAPFKSTFFLHPPWCFGRDRLLQFVEAADHYPIKTTEHGVMDRWLALIIEERCQPFTPCSWGWSVNSIDTPDFVACARQAIANGCLFIHGCKNETQLRQIMDRAPAPVPVVVVEAPAP